MWLLVTRPPRPDAPYWPGRRWLAAADAVAWPVFWVVMIRHAPEPVGLVGPVATAIAALMIVGRLRRAFWSNHRYWFTTWRWGRVAAAVWLMGVLLKVTMML